MASSNVMASTSPANPDLPRQQQQQQQSSSTTSSIHSLTVADFNPDPTKTFGSMNMDEFLKNIYSDSDTFPPAAGVGDPKNKTVDEVWKEIVAGGCGGGGNRMVEEAPPPEMTLEDFLTKAGAVSEDEVRFAGDSMMNATSQFQGSGGFGNGIDGMMVTVAAASAAGGGGSSGRGKRRTVEEPPMDKATQQKQRRMIKNRESAARSRERKQAYTVELESLVTQLEAENAGLLREEAEQSKERYKQLMENLIPVVEKRRPRRALRRVNSMCW